MRSYFTFLYAFHISTSNWFSFNPRRAASDLISRASPPGMRKPTIREVAMSFRDDDLGSGMGRSFGILSNRRPL